MKKKIIALVLAVTVLVGAIVGGTLAYLADTDSAVNVATVGNVKVEQTELQRADKNAALTSELVPFVQGQKLYPAYPQAGDAAYDLGENGLWNEAALKGVMDKIVLVENTGKSELYFRTWVAFECPTNVEFGKDIIANLNDDAFTWTAHEVVTIGETNYAVMCGTYDYVLAPKTTAPASLLQVVMNHNVDNAKVEACGDTYEVLAFTQAVQTENMESASVALDAAFPAGLPWTAKSIADETPTLVANTEEFKSAIAAGKNIALVNDIVADFAESYVTVAKGADIELNLNGHDIIATSETTGKNQNAIIVKGDLTVVGNGTIGLTFTGANMGWNNSASVFSVEGGTLTLEKGVSVINFGGSDMAYGIDVNSTGGTTTLNINGAEVYSTYTGVRLFNNHRTALNTVNFNGGVVVGNNRDIWAQNPSANAVDANAIVNIADGYEYTIEVQTTSNNSRKYYFGESVTFVGNNDDLATAIKNADKETVVLPKGEYTLPTLAEKDGVTIRGAADGSTVIGGENASTGFASNFGKNTTVENITFSGSSNGVRWSYAKGGDSTFNNCTFAGDSTYGFHIDSSNGATFTFNDCTFIGFNAFAGDLTKVVFNNCTFLSNGNYGHTNIWSVAEFNNCTWGDNTSVGQGKDSGAKLYFNGVEESYHHEFIGSAESLFAFAKSVNEGNDSWKGQKVVLVADIDLANKVWTPIGQTGATEFKGIFDGQGYTISNLKIDSSAQTGEHYSSGLFGWAESGVTIQNVKVDGATVVGNHNVAVIVGYTYSAKITNCHVTNANIVCNHANNDACGDKCGLIAGYAADESRITDCSASDSTVKAGRDAGQLVGCGYNKSMKNGAATNVTVTANGDCTGANINEALIGRVMG